LAKYKKENLGVWSLKGWAEETRKEADKQGFFLLRDLWPFFFFFFCPGGDKNRNSVFTVCSPTRRKE
jgi:hypothetical protein